MISWYKGCAHACIRPYWSPRLPARLRLQRAFTSTSIAYQSGLRLGDRIMVTQGLLSCTRSGCISAEACQQGSDSTRLHLNLHCLPVRSQARRPDYGDARSAFMHALRLYFGRSLPARLRRPLTSTSIAYQPVFHQLQGVAPLHRWRGRKVPRSAPPPRRVARKMPALPVECHGSA
jgi:hypothetical protein